jgi:hypothetical protein
MRILGVLPVISVPLGPVAFTNQGIELGLSYVWSSVRPIIKDKSIVVLAESTGLVNSEIISIKRINVFKQLFGRLNKVEIGLTGGAFELTTNNQKKAAEGFSNKLTSYEKYASAWFKRYGGTNYSGFYRIWDFSMVSLTDNRKNEFLQVVKYIRRKLVL